MKHFPLLFFSLIALHACQTSGDDPNTAPSESIPVASSAENVVRSQPVEQNDSSITAEFLMGKFNYKTHPLFSKVPETLSTKEVYIQTEVLQAFSAMHKAAEGDSIVLKILSGTRSFNEQKSIWERKWQKEISVQKTPKAAALKILEYSSMPSTSRHHWGTDIDINSLESSYFSEGQGLKEYTWLVKNANKFGFYQTYTPKDKGRTGYSVEEWHWSYMPISNKYLLRYNELISNKEITGFTGSETAAEIDVIRNFVNGIENYTFN